MTAVVAVVLSGLLLIFWRATLAILAVILLAFLLLGIATAVGQLQLHPAAVNQRTQPASAVVVHDAGTFAA